MAWTDPASREPVATLYRVGTAFRLRTPAATCHIEPVRRQISLLWHRRGPIWEDVLAGIPTVLCFLERGDIPIHAAAVEINGKALVLAAPGKGGKSTLALAFHEQGFRVLSEDVSCCRPGPVPLLFPGLALLRLRPDGFTVPPSGTTVVWRTRDRVYLSVDQQRRGPGHPVPIEAIVLLEQSVDPIVVRRLSPSQAVARLWSLSFTLPIDAFRARTFTGLAALAGHVPVWTLRRPMRRNALASTLDTLVTTCYAQPLLPTIEPTRQGNDEALTSTHLPLLR